METTQTAAKKCSSGDKTFSEAMWIKTFDFNHGFSGERFSNFLKKIH